nr:hypothetical protein [Tanacetum cinerariifolium]
MVAILEKGEYNIDFHPMVDFIAASSLRYALTVKPTVFVSHIRQFWSTARIETTDEGTQILATVDGIQRTVSESSLRRNLMLRDEDGISSLPDTELFENLTLIGPKCTGFNELSSNIATALVCLTTNRTYNFSKMIFDGMVKNVHNKISKFLMYLRFLTICLRMSQFGQIIHTHQYVVPFHTKKLFTTLQVNSPSFSGKIVLLFDTMLVHQGEGSGTPTKTHHTPSSEADPSYHTTSSMPPPSIPTAPIPPVTQPDTTPIRQYTKRVRNAQSSALPTIADEPASLMRDVSEGEDCPTESGFIADQDRATIANSSTLPYDSAPRVTSPTADEGSMQQTISKLTNLYTSLQRQHSELLAKFQAQEVEILKLKDRVKVLEDREAEDARQSEDNAPIKGRSIDEGEAATERISDDSEELARVLTSMDAATVLAGGIYVPTGSGSIPTAGPPIVDVPTGSNAVPTAKEQQEREDKRMTEQIARDAKVARIHAEEELHGMIDSLDRTNETIAKPWTNKKKKDYYMAVIKNNLGWKVKDFKGMTFEEIEAKFAAIWKEFEDFILIGSKEEAKRLKRKGFNLEQEKAKKQKTSEEVPDKEKSPEEIFEDKVKEMMQLVPIEEVYVQALQLKHPIIDWKC